MMRRGLRWLPAAVAPVLVAVGVIAANADAGVALPEKSAEEVLALVINSDVRSLSGTIEQASELGLPELPTTGTSAMADAGEWLELLSGSHTARVYLDGMEKARVQVLDTLAERDLIRHGDDLWLYDSREKAATHLRVPCRDHAGTELPQAHLTPGDLVDRLLPKLTSSTDVAVSDGVRVAGRTAYELVLTPRTADTLVGSVAVAVDSETGLPLRYAVHARGQTDAAFSVGFTSITLGEPPADLFEFTPPPGTTVTEKPEPTRAEADALPPDLPEPTVHGEGWATVVEIPAQAVPAELLQSPILAAATTSVDGGRLLSTSLLNILVTDDGRVFAGAVPLRVLQAATTGT